MEPWFYKDSWPVNHGARRTHPSHNRLLNERGSRGVQRRATRTKEKEQRGGEECMFAMTYLMIIVTAAAAAVVIGGEGMLSCSLSHSTVSYKLDGCLCPLQAAWMRKHMGVWEPQPTSWIFDSYFLCVYVCERERKRERRREREEGYFSPLSFTCHCKNSQGFTLWHSNHNCQSWIQISQRLNTSSEIEMTKRSSYNGVIKDTFRGKKMKKKEEEKSWECSSATSKRWGSGASYYLGRGTKSPTVGGQLNAKPATVPFKTNM